MTAPEKSGTKRPDGGVVTQRTANPCTRVRFPVRPPSRQTNKRRGAPGPPPFFFFSPPKAHPFAPPHQRERWSPQFRPPRKVYRTLTTKNPGERRRQPAGRPLVT